MKCLCVWKCTGRLPRAQGTTSRGQQRALHTGPGAGPEIRGGAHPGKGQSGGREWPLGSAHAQAGTTASPKGDFSPGQSQSRLGEAGQVSAVIYSHSAAQ